MTAQDVMPLDDVRVIDLTRYAAGPFATRLLADYGADVIKIEPPGGDPARGLPPFFHDKPGPERSGLFLFLNTSKRSVVLDLKTEEGHARLIDLVAGADVVVENFRPGVMERLGLDYERLAEVNPRIVLTSISNFGQDGPYRDFEATDLTLYGIGGPMLSTGEIEHAPLKTGGRVTSYHAGLVGALATATALRAAEHRGRGEHVDVSIFETAMHSIERRLGSLLGYQYSGVAESRPTLASAVGNGVYPCMDGYFMFGVRPASVPRMLRMIGREDLLEDPDWATPKARSRPERILESEVYLLPWVVDRTRAEIRVACEEFGVPGAPVNSMGDLLTDSNFVGRKFFQEIDHPETGPLTYPGYHFRLHRPEAPMPARRRAPLLGEHTEEVLAEAPRRGRIATTPTVGKTGLPLEGVRILDITVVLAGPYGTMQLADWGAEVLRIESIQHFAAETRGAIARPPQDLVDAQARGGYGGYPNGEAGARPWNRYATFNSQARNKLSMTLDLTRPGGQEVFERLVAQADGLIENNLPANIEKLGITWERLSKINPRLVMLRMPAWGLDAEYRAFRAFGHHMEALAGHQLIRTYPDEGLEYIPTGLPSDPASGMAGALAFLTGLRYRERTGRGLMVELSTAENFVPMTGEFVMDYTMNGREWPQMGNTHWWIAPHNVYRCHGEDRWVTIVARDEEEWAALCSVMRRGDLLDDPRFVDMPARLENRRELDAIIEEWTAPLDGYWVMNQLQARGIPAGVVMPAGEALRDPHLAARNFFQTIEHPEAGTYRYPARAWLASETPHVLARHAPRLGEDNEYVYRELLGFDDEQYRRFEEEGHIGGDYVDSVL